ncbi:carbohydrate ABC transporter permease [Microbacterium sp. A93]|uniref:carbohydrate ABC transporter permease n=1 Tax=Microbacterium sp. A93 TaxID=3450716 RepID=UPI003F41C134
MKKSQRLRSAVLSIVMIPIACVVGIPYYYILINTFKTQQETAASPLGLPSGLNFENYRTAFETVPIAQSFANTVYVTLFSILLMLIVGSMAAFALVMRKSRFNKLFGFLLLIAFTVPFQTILIPIYLSIAKLGLVDSLNGLIVVYSGGSIFCYFLIQGYMRTVPHEIIEAARIDGAGTFAIFWRIMLPLIRPILVTVAVFQVMWVWNDFLTPQVFLTSSKNNTLVLEVYSAVGEFSVNWPLFLTISAIALIPMVIFFVFMQKHIISGLVSGAVKA